MSKRNIQFKHSEGVKLLSVDDITHIESDKHYSVVYHKDGVFRVRRTLKSIQDEFYTDFVRSHNQILVNLYKIKSINEDIEPVGLEVEGVDYPVIASRGKLSEVKHRVGGYGDGSSKAQDIESRNNWIVHYIKNAESITSYDYDFITSYISKFGFKYNITGYGIPKCRTLDKDLLELTQSGRLLRKRVKTPPDKKADGYPFSSYIYRVADV